MATKTTTRPAAKTAKPVSASEASANENPAAQPVYVCIPVALRKKIEDVALADVIGCTTYGAGDAWSNVERHRVKFTAADLAAIQAAQTIQCQGLEPAAIA